MLPTTTHNISSFVAALNFKNFAGFSLGNNKKEYTQKKYELKSESQFCYKSQEMSIQ